MRRSRTAAAKPNPAVDPVLGRYIMHTRRDTIRNRWWALAASLGLLVASTAVYLFLRYIQQDAETQQVPASIPRVAVHTSIERLQP